MEPGELGPLPVSTVTIAKLLTHRKHDEQQLKQTVNAKAMFFL